MSERRGWLPAGLFLIASSAATAALALAPAEGSVQHAAVFAPGWAAERSFAAAAAADVAILGTGGIANIVLVSAPDAASRDALRGQGALLVLDADRLAACLSAFRPE
jgi:hypothetical protein